MRSALRQSLAGALLTPLATTVLLVALGYDPAPLVGGGYSLGFLSLALPLAVFGGVATVALRHDVWVSVYATGTVLALAAATGLFAGGPANRTLLSFLAAAWVVSVCGSLSVAAESLIRYRGVARRSVSSRALWWAARVGVVHTLCLLGTAVLVSSLHRPNGGLTGFAEPLVVVALLWLGIGALALGMVPAYLAVHSRLVTPSLLVGSVSTYLVGTTLFDELVRVTSATAVRADLVPLVVYLALWFLPLGLAVGVGLMEYGLRRLSGVYPPRSLRVRASE